MFRLLQMQIYRNPHTVPPAMVTQTIPTQGTRTFYTVIPIDVQVIACVNSPRQSWAKDPFQICVDTPSYSNPTVGPFQKSIHTQTPDTVTQVPYTVERMQKCEQTDKHPDGADLRYKRYLGAVTCSVKLWNMYVRSSFLRYFYCQRETMTSDTITLQNCLFGKRYFLKYFISNLMTCTLSALAISFQLFLNFET